MASIKMAPYFILTCFIPARPSSGSLYLHIFPYEINKVYICIYIIDCVVKISAYEK